MQLEATIVDYIISLSRPIRCRPKKPTFRTRKPAALQVLPQLPSPTRIESLVQTSHRHHGSKRSPVCLRTPPGPTNPASPRIQEPGLTSPSLDRFNQKLLVDTTPMPDHIPKVEEIGTTSAFLASASFAIGARCQAFNDDYMKCKDEANGRGEFDCLKEGRKVTRCAASV